MALLWDPMLQQWPGLDMETRGRGMVGGRVLRQEGVRQKLDERVSLTDHMRLSGLLSLLGTIQSTTLGQYGHRES